MRRIKSAIFINLNEVRNNLDYVYGPERLAWIRENTDLYPTVVSSANIEKLLPELGEIEVIFSTWGMVQVTGNFLAYIIPGMVAPYNIILVKTYIESIPGSLEESAIIDGASTFKVFLRIILPLSIPILATIAIFGAVGNWNSFQDSLLLMSSAPHLFTLQHRLYIYLNQTTSINTEQISEQMAQNLLNNGVTTKYTIAMITIIPILLVYPIMQRYFVKGIMLGAVKG